MILVLKHLNRQVQQFLEDVTDKVYQFLLLLSLHRPKQQLFTNILWNFLQLPNQVFDEIGLLDLYCSVIPLTPYILDNELLDFFFRISVVDVDEFVQMVRTNFLLLLGKNVNCFL